MRICLAIEEGQYQRVDGITLQAEIDRNILSNNIAVRGMSFQLWGKLKQSQSAPIKDRINLFKQAIKCLKESGHLLELARTYQEMSKEYSRLKKDEDAQQFLQKAIDTLKGINPDLLPVDLRSVTHQQTQPKNIPKELVELSQLFSSGNKHRELIKRAISAANEFTGAERGAIFLVETDIGPDSLELRASKNLTDHDTNHPGFKPSQELMLATLKSGHCRFLEESNLNEGSNNLDDVILSRITAPIISKNKTIGVFYQDNRILNNAFNATHYPILQYFTSLIAQILMLEQNEQQMEKLQNEVNKQHGLIEEPLDLTLHYHEIIGEAEVMNQLFNRIEQVSETKTTVLVLGETGVGKELVARAIHKHSPRQGKAFVKVHCASLPDSLITSELFGHEKGAFTGADQRRIGRFELADGGTLFLDEIGELSLDVQVRLLRVLQTGEFERVGGSATLKSDFRLILATNRDLEKEVMEGRFRSDLFYRINVFAINVPSLRERVNDIPLLAEHFLNFFSKQLGKKINRLNAQQLRILKQYQWPGNVRELENVMEKTAILSHKGNTRIPTLDESELNKPSINPNLTLKEMERSHIINVLESVGWKVKGKNGAAEKLAIPPTTLDYRMKKLGIKRPEGFKIKRTKKNKRETPGVTE